MIFYKAGVFDECFSPAVTHSQMSSVTVYHDLFSRSVCGVFLKLEREAVIRGISSA